MEANQSGSDQIGRYILLCGCGSRIIAAFPLAKDARYTCSSCSSLRTEKSRLTRVHNEAKSTALRGRLEPFLSLQLEGHEREWFELAQDIKVDAVALEALVAIIQEGKWQQSTAPLMFVRINVERRSKQWQDPFTEDGQLKRAQIFSSVPTHEDREWLRFWTDIKEQGSRVTPEDIEAASRTLSVVEDEEKRGVLCARALGLTRAQYLTGVSDVERRKRAAAWKRLNRHGLPSELRQALRGASGVGMIIRRGFEDRAWRDEQDYSRQELPDKPTPAARHDY